MPEYTVVAVARTPNATGGVDPALVELGPIQGGIVWTDILGEAGTAQISVSTDTLQEDIKDRLRDPLGLPLELWIYRDSTKVFAGPVIGGSILNSVLTIDARDLSFYTAYMLVTADKDWTTDLATIAKEVLDDWQNLTYGDYGIDASGISTIGVSRTIAGHYEHEPLSVYEFLKDLALEGCEWHVEPGTRDFIIETSKGQDLSAAVFLELGVTSSEIRFTVSPGVVASEVLGIGTGPDLSEAITTTKSDTTTRQNFGRAGAIMTFDPVEDTTRLSNLTQAALDERTETFFVPGPALIPVSGAGVEDFETGDLVTYTYDAGLGQTTGTYRVNKKTVTVHDAGQETITVEFV